MEVRDDGELEQGRLGGGQGLGMGWRQRGQWREESTGKGDVWEE